MKKRVQMMNPDFSPEEENLLKKKDYVNKKVAALLQLIKETKKTGRVTDKEFFAAGRNHVYKNLQFIKFPMDQNYRKLLFGLALYGVELINKSEKDPAAKKEILSYMERCDKYYKERNADMDQSFEDDEEEPEEQKQKEDSVNKEPAPVSTAIKTSPAAPIEKSKPLPVNQKKPDKSDDLEIMIDDDGNILTE